jgi:O-antigen/teichoic acid export membrane protein
MIVIGLFTTAIVTRILGPERRGLYDTAMAGGANGVQFGNLGVHSSSTVFVAQDRSLLSVLYANSVVIRELCVGFCGSDVVCLRGVAPMSA